MKPFIILASLSSAVIATGVVLAVLAKKKERRMKEALKEQEHRLYEEKVALLINMSHELRTPLTLIMAPLKRMLVGMDPQDKNHETLSRMYRQARRMKDLLNIALDLRKMEVGKSVMKMEKHNFNKWLSETTEDIVSEEMAEGIEIARDLDPAIQEVSFDKSKCDTIILNILINAIKHSQKGDTIRIRSRLTEENMVRVSVSDMGQGLGDVDPAGMFTQFYQSPTERYGSGIGLAYSKILVELHGGRIAAENNMDRGATFWWEIPVAPAFMDDASIPSKAYLNELMGYDPGDMADAPESEDFSTATMTLMLVDDNRDLLEFVREALCSEFSNIILAESGNKAMGIIAQDKLPDIIVSDINMPDGDGYRLCKRLKSDEKYSHIPIILLTARGEEQSQSDSYRMGADGYMAKPFEIDTLMEMVRGILRRRAEIRKKYLEFEDEGVIGYGSNEEAFILKFNRIIEENISNTELDQQFLCKELGISRALLYNKMKAITGAGAKEYITRIRLEKAKHLIETSNLTIAEISDKTGFASQSYFSTAFKAYTGKSPSRYKADVKRGC